MVLMARPEVKRQLGRPRPRWDGNIITDIQEVGLGGGGSKLD